MKWGLKPAGGPKPPAAEWLVDPLKQGETMLVSRYPSSVRMPFSTATATAWVRLLVPSLLRMLLT